MQPCYEYYQRRWENMTPKEKKSYFENQKQTYLEKYEKSNES